MVSIFLRVHCNVYGGRFPTTTRDTPVSPGMPPVRRLEAPLEQATPLAAAATPIKCPDPAHREVVLLQ